MSDKMNVPDPRQAKSICDSIRECSICRNLTKAGALSVEEKEVGLDYSFPNKVPIEILFIAESPPAPEKGFFYDQTSSNTIFRTKLFNLINRAGLGEVRTISDFNEKGFYLADSINCRWDKSLSSSLSNQVFENCSVHLAKQIDLFQPRNIVAMGENSQTSLKYQPVQNALEKIDLDPRRIIKMSFILVAPNETDEQRIAKLRTICPSGH